MARRSVRCLRGKAAFVAARSARECSAINALKPRATPMIAALAPATSLNDEAGDSIVLDMMKFSMTGVPGWSEGAIRVGIFDRLSQRRLEELLKET